MCAGVISKHSPPRTDVHLEVGSIISLRIQTPRHALVETRIDVNVVIKVFVDVTLTTW